MTRSKSAGAIAETLEKRIFLAAQASPADLAAIDPPLLALAKTGVNAAQRAAHSRPGGMMFDNRNRVGVRITAQNVNSVLSLLASDGFTTLSAHPKLHYVEGYIPAGAIPSLAKLRAKGLLGVLPMYSPITMAGSVTAQSDSLMGADRARPASGFDGTGVTVGVLSDSYNNLGGASSDVASGDLPANVNVLQDLSSGGTDEGRAMLQVVHDVAPGANLAFATAYVSESQFASNIVNLAKPVAQGGAGAGVIVDDVQYLDEPFFQDGPIAQAVDTSVNTYGAAYFSAAGNNDTQSYESTNVNFISGTIGSISHQSSSYYNFNPTGTATDKQSFTLNQNQSVEISLQWDQPFFTTSGVTTNLQLYILKDSSGSVVASGKQNAVSSQTPLQQLQFTNAGASATYDVVIRKTTGAAPGRIKYLNFANGNDVNFSFATNSDTINPHAASANAMAVAAAPYYDQRNKESYTSSGPVNILFDSAGNRFATPIVRAKPDITALDGLNTTFFGFDFENDGFPNFFGTSRAAPDAAAVAALIRQAHPDFTPTQIYSLMKSTADPNIGGTPGNPNFVGAGLINAYAALQGAVVPATSVVSDGFENGFLGANWDTYARGAGRVDVSSGNSPSSGTYQLVEDTPIKLSAGSSSGFSNLSEAILHVNLASMSGVTLTFDMKSFANSFETADAMPATFTGHGNYDGVAMSIDGTNWFRVQSLMPSSSSSAYQTYTADLSSIAAANGLALGADVQIKFQHYDARANSAPNSGFAFDNVKVGGALNLSGPAFYLKLDSDHQHADIWTNSTGAGSPSQSLLVSLLSGLSITGAGANQSVTVDFTNGDPLAASGLVYAGSAALLTILGDGNSDTFNASGSTVSATGTFGTVPINYSGVASIAIHGGAGNATLNQNAPLPAAISFSGSGGSDTLNINAGGFAFAGDAQIGTSSLTVNVAAGASATFNSIQHLAALNINGGSAFVAPGGNNTLVVGSLSLTNNAHLDLADNSMIVDYTGSSPIATIAGYLASAFNGGTWDGAGIASSAAAADPQQIHALGYAEASDLGISTFANENIDSTAVVIRYTKYGDNNLDGTVDIGNDFALITDALAATNASSWFHGDYTYDGKVDLGNDFTLFLRGYLS